jgi:hypothetical protein
MAVTPPDGTAGGGGVVGTGSLGTAVGGVVAAGRCATVVGGVVGEAVVSGRGNVELVVDGGGCTFVVEGSDGSDPTLPSERTNEPALR